MVFKLKAHDEERIGYLDFKETKQEKTGLHTFISGKALFLK